MVVNNNNNNKIQIDKNIYSNLGSFQFDKNVALQFDSHVRKSVPFYDEIQRMIVEMSDWFIHSNSLVYDLGCSVGETITNLYHKHSKLKSPRFIGIDSSKEMLDIARKNLINNNGYHNVTFIEYDLNLNYEIQESSTSLITMLYTLQFLKPESRHKIIQECYKGLHDNGALIIIEKIVGNNPKFNEIWIELYNDLKLRNNLTLEQIKSKTDSLRGILLSYSQDKNIKLLRNAGFEDIDIFFKWYNFIGIIAIK
jgi:tRNA (cmo5U34)-methyltransferase